MRLKDLKSVLRSRRGFIQFAIIYDSETNNDIESSCSIELKRSDYKGDRCE